MNKLVIVDGNSIAFRAFFALPLLNNGKGVYTNAVYGFTTMILKILEDEQPTHMLVAFDAGKTTFRHKTFKEYKGQREKTPSELSEQLPVMRDLLQAFHISYYELENYEADDIIGTLSTRATMKNDDWNVKIFTGDKDLLQLVNEKVQVSLTRKGITNVDTYDIEKLADKYGIAPKQIIDMKGLMGDSSDNIPGVPSVGEKTALKLLKQFGTLDGVYESIEEVSGKKLKEKLKEYHDQAVMSKELATIMIDAPIDVNLDELKRRDPNTSELIKLFKELEFASLLNRFDSGEEVEQEKMKELTVDIVEELNKEILASPSAFVVEALGENYHQAEVIGFSLANENGVFFIPREVAINSSLFKAWAADASKQKYLFNAKRAVVALGWQDVELNGVLFDIQIASYLIDPSVKSHEIADIALRKNSQRVQADETVYGKGKKREQPSLENLAQHLGRKASAVFHLKGDLQEELVENNQLELFEKLEMPLSVILGRMEMEGVSIDKAELENIGQGLVEKLHELEKQIHHFAGEKFNINSPKQLGEILFDKLQLPAIKKTKTGYSTSADVLEKLKDQHEMIPTILHYRQLGKLNSTYIEGLLKVIHQKTAKIHTIFNQALTQTGRLSSTEPNLQNIPIRLEEGRKIRHAFIPEAKGAYLFAADYSQIELRVLAHISQDENLKQAFTDNMDVHMKTAMDVFEVEAHEVTDQMRRTAKAVNFGIVYGISDYGLAENLGITRKKAKLFIEKYFQSYPGVKNYMEDIVEEAREKGFVTTMLHRRRYLPELTSRNFNLRSFAERTAMNTPIQGSAADIIKKAMVDMAEALEKEALHSKMLLQVHDELIFEVPEVELARMKQLVPMVMEAAVKLDVPLVADVAYGETWYDAK